MQRSAHCCSWQSFQYWCYLLQASAMGAARSWRRISVASADSGTMSLVARCVPHLQLKLCLCGTAWLCHCKSAHLDQQHMSAPARPKSSPVCPCRSITAHTATCAAAAPGLAWTHATACSATAACTCPSLRTTSAGTCLRARCAPSTSLTATSHTGCALCVSLRNGMVQHVRLVCTQDIAVHTVRMTSAADPSTDMPRMNTVLMTCRSCRAGISCTRIALGSTPATTTPAPCAPSRLATWLCTSRCAWSGWMRHADLRSC